MLNKIAAELKKNWRIEGFKSNAGFTNKAYLADYQPQDFVETEIPSSVQNALFQAGKIPDPYVEYNAEHITWIEDREWWYYNDFATPDTKKGQNVFVLVEGITYRAEAWLNGNRLGTITGMFRTAEFNITPYLRKDGKSNRLTFRIRPLENTFESSIDPHRSTVRTTGPVAQSMYVWNWTPHMVCIGIWKPVKILLRSSAAVDFFRVNTVKLSGIKKTEELSPAANASIELEWTLKNSSDKKDNFLITFAISGETFRGVVGGDTFNFSLKPGETKVIKKKIVLEKARLWWPNGLGKAELHKVNFQLSSDNLGQIEDRSEIFGIRTFAWERNEDEEWVVKTSGATERPWSMIGEMYKWILLVNGRRVFMKGSNWVMLDTMLRLEKWRYDRQLSIFKASGLNFLRVWGGSLAETDEFYDLCDRYGILCWQEFWLACGNYAGMDHEAFISCVDDTVKRLVNRASLIYYSGGNEYEPDNIENKELVDKIAAAVAKIDPVREFRRGSPYKGDRHGGLVTTPYVTRNKYLDVLYGDKRIVLMRSEVATGRSTPMLSSFEKMMPEKSRWPIDEKMWRNFFAVPFEFLMYANEYGAADEYRPAIYANYLWHAQICRINMEYCRTRMFKSTGNLNWQFNVPWPCMHREIVDTWGVPKPAFYYYVNSSRPRIVSIDIEKYLWNPGETFDSSVYVVNEEDNFDGTVKIEVFLPDTNTVFRKEIPFESSGNNSVKIGSLDYRIPQDFAERTVFVKASLCSGGKVIHENLYWFAVSNHHEPDSKIVLNGEWKRADKSRVILPGNDMAVKNPSFEYVILKKGAKACDLENKGNSTDQHAAEKEIRYTKTFRIPKELKNMDLEFFTPGFESSDEVYVNGHKIGSHEFKPATLDPDTFAMVPYGKEESSIYLDPESEYMFYSDPMSMPKLQARFYDIPASILKQDGQNEIELVMKTYYQKAVAYPLEIRPVTSNRKEVASFLKKGVFYSELRRMPAAKVDIKTDKNSIVLKNISDKMAFSIFVEFIPESSNIAVPLSDNSLTLMPGEEKEVSALLAEKKFEFPAQLRVYGWNIDEIIMNISKA